MEEGRQRWLVSPYGITNWVKNVRTAGQAELRWNGSAKTVKLREVDAATAASSLKIYLAQAPIVRPYFDARPDSPLGAFAAEAPRHPVFRIEHP
jgi:hypothetical protein